MALIIIPQIVDKSRPRNIQQILSIVNCIFIVFLLVCIFIGYSYLIRNFVGQTERGIYMADIVVTSIGNTGAQFYIENLGYLWDTNQYSQAYATVNGVSTAPVYPPSPPGTGYTTGWGNITGLSPGTSYVAYGYVVTAPPGNATVACGSFAFTTTGTARPALFDWSISKASGVRLQVSAQEIKNLQDNINAVRNYKGFTPYSFTTWPVGATANSVALWTEIYNAISTLNPPQVPVVPNSSTVFNNSSFFASYKNSINSVT
ncbi:hypothetical protein [Gordoniibacillus kamchatkensis]|uniref:hypothetical protein n=1 Tax=Gordoniibacillus kamchatkensis TaxID=1590651 RepID=UPI0012E02055|nr:hypothetical protein [Paenibacillus sp. VKM B-2647]